MEEKIFRYYSSPDSKNRVTVVGQKVDNKLVFAVSRCSDKDHFCRKEGRQIAETRLNNGNILTYIPMSENEKLDTRTFVLYAKHIASLVRDTKKTH